VKILSMVLIVLMLSVGATAQTKSNDFKFTHPQLDGSTLGHMGKGGLTYSAFRLIGVGKRTALIAVLSGAIAYEMIHDGLGVTKYSDPAGADLVGDVVADCFGGVILCCLEILLRIDKRINLYAYDNQIGIRIAI